MNKHRLVLILIAAIGTVTSFVLLRFVYRIDYCLLLHDFLIAVFTGCIIAIPSCCIVIIEERRNSVRNLNKLVNRLSVLLKRTVFNEKDYNCYVSQDNERIKQEIVNIHHQISYNLYENYSFNKIVINNLLNELFDFSYNIALLHAYYEAGRKPPRKNYKKCIMTINQHKQKCIDIIADMQK